MDHIRIILDRPYQDYLDRPIPTGIQFLLFEMLFCTPRLHLLSTPLVGCNMGNAGLLGNDHYTMAVYS